MCVRGRKRSADVWGGGDVLLFGRGLAGCGVVVALH